MKKITIFTITLLTIILIISSFSSATDLIDNEPSGKLTPPPEDLLAPLEYDHKELSPEEAEILKDVEGMFLLKMMSDWPWDRDIKNQWPVEAIANDRKKFPMYVFLQSDGKLGYYQIRRGELVPTNDRIDEYNNSMSMIKAAYREDLFKQAEITKDISDISVLETYCIHGSFCKNGDIIYFRTNKGDFIHYSASWLPNEEYLFPKDLFYEHEGNVANMKLAIDVTPYLIKVRSNTLPLPNPDTSDPSSIFAIMSVISAGGFTVFAAKKAKKKDE